jgi:CelD/BcsL family acetyltransferase involved in cellulose biosynthesis
VKVSEVVPTELGPAELATWEKLRRASPSTESPFFAAEYTLAVAAARAETRIGVVEDDGAIAAFLPYERRRRRALPVGTGLTDYQGAVSESDSSWSPSEALRALGLRAYVFDHVPAADPCFRPYVRHGEDSPVLDHPGELAVYLEECRLAGRDGPREALKKGRRLARAAEVRFELDDRSPGALATLLAWKTEQHRRTGSFPVFELPWVVEVLERLRDTRANGFAGVLSGLYADDELIAANLGLRSGSLLHSWVLGFDRRFARLSPGSILLLALFEAMPEHGLRRFDFGKGREPYKRRFANGAVELGEGAVTVGPLAAASNWLRPKAMRLAMATPLAGPIGRRHHRRFFGVQGG